MATDAGQDEPAVGTETSRVANKTQKRTGGAATKVLGAEAEELVEHVLAHLLDVQNRLLAVQAVLTYAEDFTELDRVLEQSIHQAWAFAEEIEGAVELLMSEMESLQKSIWRANRQSWRINRTATDEAPGPTDDEDAGAEDSAAEIKDDDDQGGGSEGDGQKVSSDLAADRPGIRAGVRVRPNMRVCCPIDTRDGVVIETRKEGCRVKEEETGEILDVPWSDVLVEVDGPADGGEGKNAETTELAAAAT